jgi:hypothetical protein
VQKDYHMFAAIGLRDGRVWSFNLLRAAAAIVGD